MANSRNFYQNFFPIFWVIASCTIPIAIIGGFIDFGFVLWKIFLLFLIVVGFDIMGTYLIIKMPITVSSEGIKCMDWMWTFKFISWDKILYVRLSRAFFGLPYIRISLNESKDVIWLPLFLNELSDFISLVINYTDENNILSKELKDYLSTK